MLAGWGARACQLGRRALPNDAVALIPAPPIQPTPSKRRFVTKRAGLAPGHGF